MAGKLNDKVAVITGGTKIRGRGCQSHHYRPEC